MLGEKQVHQHVIFIYDKDKIPKNYLRSNKFQGFSRPGSCFNKHDGWSTWTTDHCPMLFVVLVIYEVPVYSRNSWWLTNPGNGGAFRCPLYHSPAAYVHRVHDVGLKGSRAVQILLLAEDGQVSAFLQHVVAYSGNFLLILLVVRHINIVLHVCLFRLKGKVIKRHRSRSGFQVGKVPMFRRRLSPNVG